MEKITSQDMFERFCTAGRGYIYNDFSGKGASGAKYNVLHMATCRTLQRARVVREFDKYFNPDMASAIAWLKQYRGREGENWKRCDAQNMNCFG